MIVIPNLRLARPTDAQLIAEMSREYIEYGLAWNWTPARVLLSIHDKATNVVVVHARRSMIGFGIMLYGEHTAHLALLAVHPDYRKQGVASRLLRWLEGCADTAGIGQIQVEARADNPIGLVFYRSQGYVPIGTLPGYYRGRIDAIRFEKKLWVPQGEASA